MVVISIGPYKERSPKQIDSIGQRARFKVNPQRVGYIVQSIQAFAFLDESIDQFNYTEAWRIQSNKKIEQQGDDDFRIPRQWTRDHSGRFYIIAHAWYQESLGDDFVRGASNDLWGRLKWGPHIPKYHPRVRKCLNGFGWRIGRKVASPRSKIFGKND